MLNQFTTSFVAVENEPSNTLQTTLFIADLTISNTLMSDEPTQPRNLDVSTTVGFSKNTSPSDLSDSKANKPLSDVFAAVGVIVGIITILAILLGVRYFKNRSRPNNSSAFIDQQNNDMTATDQPPQIEYDDVIAVNDERVVNEVYVFADLPMKNPNPKQDALANDQEVTYSVPIKNRRPKMIDNALNESYDG